MKNYLSLTFAVMTSFSVFASEFDQVKSKYEANSQLISFEDLGRLNLGTCFSNINPKPMLVLMLATEYGKVKVDAGPNYPAYETSKYKMAFAYPKSEQAITPESISEFWNQHTLNFLGSTQEQTNQYEMSRISDEILTSTFVTLKESENAKSPYIKAMYNIKKGSDNVLYGHVTLEELIKKRFSSNLKVNREGELYCYFWKKLDI